MSVIEMSAEGGGRGRGRVGADVWQAQELGVVEPEQQQHCAAAADAVSSEGCGNAFFGVEAKENLGGWVWEKEGRASKKDLHKAQALHHTPHATRHALQTSLVSARVVIRASRSRQRARHTAPEGHEVRGMRSVR